MKNKLTILILVMFSLIKSYAQQDPHFTQYMFNFMTINPAYVGNRDFVHTTLFYRNQWLGINGAPVTQSLGVTAPLQNNKVGVGLNIVNTAIGASNLFNIKGAYNYRIQTSRTGTLSMGVSAGLVQFNIDPNKLVTYDPISSDQVFAGNTINKLVPDFGTGIFFQEKNFSLGLAIPHLFQTKVKFNNAVPLSDNNTNSERNSFAKLSRHYYASGLYIFEVNYNLDVIPSALAKFVVGAPPQIDLNLNLVFHDLMWGGMSYRSGDAVAFMTGIYFEKKVRRIVKQVWRLGYAYDLTASRLSQYSNGSHEIMLSFDYLIQPTVKCPNPDRRAY
jgi:type IX secretion system PorP/SprF family membrane protein